MAKKIVKKAPAKKASQKVTRKITSLAKGKPKKAAAKKAAVKKAVSKKVPVKKEPVKKASAKTSVKDTEKSKLTEKQLLQREANHIANSEKKKTTKKRVKSSTIKQTNGLLDSVIEGMQERKAKNIVVLDLSKIENRVADYFVICDADSNTHVNAIADSIEETVAKQIGEKPYHTEGHQNGEWIIIDYINIVTHVFMREIREYYNIEGLWGDAEIRTID